MSREPLPGELAARIDDLDEQVHSLRNAMITLIVLGAIFWFDLRERKGGKDVD